MGNNPFIINHNYHDQITIIKCSLNCSINKLTSKKLINNIDRTIVKEVIFYLIIICRRLKHHYISTQLNLPICISWDMDNGK
jgi:hypothetical protein